MNFRVVVGLTETTTSLSWRTATRPFCRPQDVSSLRGFLGTGLNPGID